MRPHGVIYHIHASKVKYIMLRKWLQITLSLDQLEHAHMYEESTYIVQMNYNVKNSSIDRHTKIR